MDLSDRGSKESGNRKYGTNTGKACKRGCKGRPHPDNLCPKNRKSIMHPSNKRKRDARTHKESKKNDKAIKPKSAGCFGVIVALVGTVGALGYGLLEIARAVL